MNERRVEVPVDPEKRFVKETFGMIFADLPIKADFKRRIISALRVLDEAILDVNGQPLDLSPIKIKVQKDNIELLYVMISSLRTSPELLESPDAIDSFEDQLKVVGEQVGSILDTYENILADIENPLPVVAVETPPLSDKEVVDQFIASEPSIASEYQQILNITPNFPDLTIRDKYPFAGDDDEGRDRAGLIIQADKLRITLLTRAVENALERRYVGKSESEAREKIIIQQKLLRPLDELSDKLQGQILKEFLESYDRAELGELLYGEEDGLLDEPPFTTLLADIDEVGDKVSKEPVGYSGLTSLGTLKQRIEANFKAAEVQAQGRLLALIPGKFHEEFQRTWSTQYALKTAQSLRALEKLFYTTFEKTANDIGQEADGIIQNYQSLATPDLPTLYTEQKKLSDKKTELDKLLYVKFFSATENKTTTDIEDKVKAKISEIDKIEEEIETKQLDLWKQDVLPGEIHLLELNAADTDAKTALAGTDKTVIAAAKERLEKARKEAFALVPTKVLVDTQEVLIKGASHYLNQLVAASDQTVLAAAERLSTLDEVEREEMKTSLSGLIEKINKLDLEDETHTLDSLKKEYADEFKDLEDRFDKGGIPPASVSSRYAEAKKKLGIMVESATIRGYPFSKVVSIASEKNYDVFVDTKSTRTIADPYEKAIVKRVQALYYTETAKFGVKNADGSIDENDPETEKLRIEHRRQKVRMFAYRYRDDNYPKTGVPAAKQENLYSLFGPRRLSRKDILEGVTNHEIYGQHTQDLLRYVIDVVGEDIPTRSPKPAEMNPDGTVKERARFYTARELEICYDDLAKNPDGPLKLENHLKEIFVASGLLPLEHFEIVWNLYITFDLASISLAKLQKRTKTRSHNPTKPVDTEYLSYPFHVMSHKRNRYGNLDSAHQHLLEFTGDYPNDEEKDQFGNLVYRDDSGNVVPAGTRDSTTYLWAGNQSKRHGTHVRTVRTTQRLVRLWTNAYFPTKGIEGRIYTDKNRQKLNPKTGKQEDNDNYEGNWNKPIFPDHFQFLTESEDRIGNIDLYTTAQKGWDKMLKMTVGPISAGLKMHDIFGAEHGLYTEFLNNGIGLAKVVAGPHHNWFVPMLRYLIGRIGVGFYSEAVNHREELRKELVEQLKIGTGVPRGAVGFDELLAELEGKDATQFAGSRWNKMPDILRPFDQGRRRDERVAYMRAWYKDKTDKEPPSLLQRVNPGKDEYIKTYYDAIDEVIPLPVIIDRASASTDTAEKKAA
ncbi:MAG: hypothetical protein ABI425_03370 [Patescibacteria group bacterium]